MAMKDIYHYTAAKLALFKAFAAADGTTAVTGNAIDLTGFNAALFTVTANYSATDAAEYTLSLKHSDDGTSYTDATGDYIVGPSEKVSGAANVQKIGYIGGRKYVKLVATPSAAATSTNTITFVAHAILQQPEVMPA